MREFEGKSLNRIAFPLGGIGTGSISLGGRGNLTDWEIFNRPGKGTVLPYSMFFLRLASKSMSPVVRVIEGEIPPPFEGPHGLPWWHAGGLPRFREARFKGGFPIAEVQFNDDTVPLDVSLQAYNPFIPLASEDSGLPAAILEYRIANTTSESMEVSVAGTLFNILGYSGAGPIADPKFPAFRRFHVDFNGNANETRRSEVCSGIFTASRAIDATDHRFGSLCLSFVPPSTTGGRTFDLDLTAHLPRHRLLFDRLRSFWVDLESDGRLDPSSEEVAPTGESDIGAISARTILEPGETVVFRYLITWHFPNRLNIWEGSLDPDSCNYGILLQNHYAKRFTDAWHVAVDLAGNIDRLEEDTRNFRDALYSSSLPPQVLDAAGSCLSVLKSNTCFRTDDGVFHAFEGSGADKGSCPLDCTHVWNYDQALGYFFPDLARSMRRTDFLNNTDDNGYMSHRTVLPAGSGPCGRPPAVDGQLGSILKLYREWMLSGDRAFLLELWPRARACLEYVFTGWDANKDGLIDGDEQLNTYDCVWVGANPMIQTLYLASLRAASRIAEAAGDPDRAILYADLYRRGSERCDELLWTGEYYRQVVPAGYEDRPKQIAEGCLSDQLIGQWFAHLLGLGYLLPVSHVRSTLRAVFSNNFRESLRSHPAAYRTYALQDESGLLNCTFPAGSGHDDTTAVSRAGLRHGFFDEVWSGVEYQVAASLVFEGCNNEAERIVDGVRRRYDGERRNPWNEIECGDHYARSLAAWSLIPAYAGFIYSAPDQTIGFSPRTGGEQFRTFWSCGTAWGVFQRSFMSVASDGGLTDDDLAAGSQDASSLIFNLTVIRGGITVRQIILGIPETAEVAQPVEVDIEVAFNGSDDPGYDVEKRTGQTGEEIVIRTSRVLEIGVDRPLRISVPTLPDGTLRRVSSRDSL